MSRQIRLPFKGMMAPTFTPFKDDGSLDLDLVKPYAAHLKAVGVTGVWVNGTAGEGMSMTLPERKAVAESWLACRADVPVVIVQCGAGCLKDTQDLARHAAEKGADGVAVLPLVFDPPKTTDDLVDYMVEVAKACPSTPLFYYHIPMKTGVKLSMSEFLEKGVKRIPTLSGIKFTDEDVSGEGRKCLKVDGGNLTVFNGFDQMLQKSLSVGFTSSVNAGFTFLPHLGARIFSLMEAGDVEEALKVQERLTSCYDIIYRQNGGAFSAACMKAASSILTGLQFGPTRLPVKPLTEEMRATLKRDLEKHGLKVY